jgi:hypothetical protein
VDLPWQKKTGAQPPVLRRHLVLQLLRETQGLFERLQAGSNRLATKIEAGGRLQTMLTLL